MRQLVVNHCARLGLSVVRSYRPLVLVAPSGGYCLWKSWCLQASALLFSVIKNSMQMGNCQSLSARCGNILTDRRRTPGCDSSLYFSTDICYTLFAHCDIIPMLSHPIRQRKGGGFREFDHIFPGFCYGRCSQLLHLQKVRRKRQWQLAKMKAPESLPPGLSLCVFREYTSFLVTVIIAYDLA